MQLNTNDLVFAKVKPNAIIPTKREEDAGRDVYACFDEDYILILPHTTVLIPTGIASAMTSKYEIRLRDRGSNGSKGIHVNAGSIDSGYRNEWFVAWCNTNSCPVLLSKLSIEDIINKYGKRDNDDDIVIPKDLSNINANANNDDYYPLTDNIFIFDDNEDFDKIDDIIVYPYTKAIAQAEVCEVPVMNQYEISYEDLLKIESERGTGMLGSSGK